MHGTLPRNWEPEREDWQEVYRKLQEIGNMLKEIGQALDRRIASRQQRVQRG